MIVIFYKQSGLLHDYGCYISNEYITCTKLCNLQPKNKIMFYQMDWVIGQY